MDGRLLVLCDEDVTLNSYNERVDKEGNLLRKMDDGSYEDMHLNKVEVDEHKDVISAIDLIMPIQTQSIENRDILFVNWETVVPQDIEYLQKLVLYSRSTEPLPVEMLQEGLKQKDSIMKRAHEKTFHAMQDQRPSLDYGYISIEEFMRSLYDMIEKQGIVRVLPCYCKETNSEVKIARQRILNTFMDRNEMNAKNGNESKIKIIEPIEYKEFGEVYVRAKEEMMKIYSAPDWYDAPQDIHELGDR